MKRKVLFLCTRNQARSQMAEAILNKIGKDNFIAFSAGTEPAAKIHPMTVKALQSMGIDASGKHPKSVSEVEETGFDFVITLCDKARENCPSLLGKPMLAHWGFDDPVVFEGADEEKLKHFIKIATEIASRINLFIALSQDKIDTLALDVKKSTIDVPLVTEM